MNWLQEILKDIENKDELIKAVKKGIGENFIPREEFNSKNEEVKELTNQIKERDKQLKDIKAAAKDNEDLTAKIEELQESNKTIKKDYEEKLALERKNSAIRAHFAGKVHDVDLIADMVKDQVELTENGLKGIDDLEKKYREEKSFLFLPEDNNQGEGKGFKWFSPKPEDGESGPEKSLGSMFAQEANKQNKNKIWD